MGTSGEYIFVVFFTEIPQKNNSGREELSFMAFI
jgi:hypothetical protein